MLAMEAARLNLVIEVQVTGNATESNCIVLLGMTTIASIAMRRCSDARIVSQLWNWSRAMVYLSQPSGCGP
jgi:hypothetical protein